MVILSFDLATQPPNRHITTMTSNVKQRINTKELDELQDELDELCELFDL